MIEIQLLYDFWSRWISTFLARTFEFLRSHHRRKLSEIVMGKLCLCDFDFFGFPSKELESIPNEIEQQNTNKPINKPVYESVYLQVVWQHSTI
jgi:hypothetical protein